MAIRFLDEAPIDTTSVNHIRFLDEPVKPVQEPSFIDNVFPSSYDMPSNTAGQKAFKGLAGIVDILGVPKRALGMVRGGKMSEPETGILQPEINRLKTKLSEADKIAEYSHVVKPSTIVDIVGDLIQDPLTYAGGIAGKSLNTIRKAKGFSLTDIIKIIKPSEEFNVLKQGAKTGKLTEELKATEEGLKPIQEISGGLQPSAAPEKTMGEKIFGRISEGDRSILSEKTSIDNIPFTDYALMAKKAVENPRNMTPMDFAGSRAKQAMDDIAEKRKAMGSAKEQLFKDYENKQSVWNIDKINKTFVSEQPNIINTVDVKNQWSEMLKDRLGIGGFDENGSVIPIPGRAIRKPSEMAVAKEIDGLIKQLGDAATPQKVDDIKSAIYDAYIAPKASQVKQMKTTTEAIADNINHVLDSKISEALGENYKKINGSYRELKDLETFLNQRLGQVVDPLTGQTRHGASLMKSAVQSNADRGTKATFNRIMNITGIDLVKEAKYAEIAMKGVKDSRINNLLDIADVPLTSHGALATAVSKVSEKVRKDPIQELIDFYLEQQKLKSMK